MRHALRCACQLFRGSLWAPSNMASACLVWSPVQVLALRHSFTSSFLLPGLPNSMGSTTEQDPGRPLAALPQSPTCPGCPQPKTEGTWAPMGGLLLVLPHQIVICFPLRHFGTGKGRSPPSEGQRLHRGPDQWEVQGGVPRKTPFHKMNPSS